VQQLDAVTPDLTAMGKIIGGGLPIGAFGGRRDLMQLFDPERRESGPVFHASTFSGNPLSMAAGLAAMRAYTGAEAQRLNALGDRLRDGFNRAFRDSGVRGQAAGQGSLVNLHLTSAPLRHARETVAALIEAAPIGRLLHLAMLRRGINSASRLMYCVSTPMGELEIDRAIDALRDALAELRPSIEKLRPALLA
jgi:glutamate-1-semialdehyde 2,1-aminomutase